MNPARRVDKLALSREIRWHSSGNNSNVNQCLTILFKQKYTTRERGGEK
jgi:hypothetical protein